IPNAINIDFNSGDFETQLQKLDPAKEYYVYCASGNRSGQATRVMAQKGFKNIYNMSNGGYSNWQRMNR
ncbi:MAG: rhodanese-like domain-containing protein, partial [Bacteroidia bacterium]